jgi:hypothetical protein
VGFLAAAEQQQGEEEGNGVGEDVHIDGGAESEETWVVGAGKVLEGRHGRVY